MEVAKLAISLCFLFPAITASRQEDLFDEPRCSKFHFEEKLLEKVVRFEVKLETMQTKFDELANQLMTQQQIVTQDRGQLLTDARALKADLTSDAQALKADLTNDAQSLKADLTSDAQDLRTSLETSQGAADGRVDELVKTTQSQVARMSGDVHTLLNKTIADIIDARALKADLTSDAQALKADLTSDTQALKADLTSDAQALKADLTSDAQVLRTSLETSQAAVDGRVDELVKTTQSQVARMSGDIHTSLNKTIADIIDAANLLPVAFSAKSLKDKKSSGGDVLVFEQVMMNLGGGYDADTGQFTAPQSGVYLFTVQLCLSAKSYKDIHIVTGTGLNAVKISGISVYYGCQTSTAIASLIQGESVMTQYQTSLGGSLIQSSNYAGNMFSGALIHNHN